jgi:DNA adenine methylase
VGEALKPPFTYFGGKTALAERIVALMPPHEHYVEPFAGSLSVLLAKPPSRMETVNDLDGDLMTFWRVLRARSADLERACALTPHSRAEHQAAFDIDGAADDELERARRVWVLLSQGRQGRLDLTGWRYIAKPTVGIGMPAFLGAYTERMPPAARRIARVSLECRDAIEVVRDYGQHADVLLYCDPPYLGSARSTGYRHEMLSSDEHRELAFHLHGCKATVVLSGYRSPLYDELYPGWHRKELKAWTGNGIRNGAARSDGDRTEVLWSNRPFSQGSLFDQVEDAAAS